MEMLLRRRQLLCVIRVASFAVRLRMLLILLLSVYNVSLDSNCFTKEKHLISSRLATGIRRGDHITRSCSNYTALCEQHRFRLRFKLTNSQFSHSNVKLGVKFTVHSEV